MAHATNPVDGVRTYFEDSEGAGPPVLFYTGFADPLEVAKASGLTRALSGEFRLIFGDHRGQGGSDKPHETGAYLLGARVADAVAVLDALGIETRAFPRLLVNRPRGSSRLSVTRISRPSTRPTTCWFRTSSSSSARRPKQ